MSWSLGYLPEAEKDLKDLDGSQRILVLKALKKVLQNPLPESEGGYGKPSCYSFSLYGKDLLYILYPAHHPNNCHICWQ
jgi:hypothetical protein